MMEPQKKPSTQTNNHLITANSLPHDNDSDVLDDDYDIEQQSGDDEEEQYYDEKEQQLAQLHIQAMMQQVLKLTEQCGDVNLAMHMMRLDAFEKSLVIRNI